MKNREQLRVTKPFGRKLRQILFLQYVFTLAVRRPAMTIVVRGSSYFCVGGKCAEAILAYSPNKLIEGIFPPSQPKLIFI
jgi:hypothetical protein